MSIIRGPIMTCKIIAEQISILFYIMHIAEMPLRYSQKSRMKIFCQNNQRLKTANFFAQKPPS